MPIDWTSELGQRVQDRLTNDQCVWFTTVSDSGTPLPTLVWFWWDSDTLLIYTQPEAVKLRNIEKRSSVSLNFNSDPDGHQMDVIFGKARMDTSAPPIIDHPEYVAKYTAGMEYIGMTPESFSAAFSVPIRVSPEKIRGF